MPQVILKPDPGQPLELYLGSLAALGVDTRAHDVRFVEDNWENPTLGAWGLGWEVWMDGACCLASLPWCHTCQWGCKQVGQHGAEVGNLSGGPQHRKTKKESQL